MGLDLAQSFREGLAKLCRSGPGLRMILMIVDLRSAGACGRKGFQDRCTFLMEAGLGVVHEYTVFVERGVVSRWMGWEVVLGWNVAKGGIAQLKKCGYGMDRRFRTVS